MLEQFTNSPANGKLTSGDVHSLGETELGNDKGTSVPRSEDHDVIVVIERRVLFRDCISRSLAELVGRDNVLAYADLDEWIANSASNPKPAIIVLCTGQRRRLDDHTIKRIAELGNGEKVPPMVLLSESEDADEILDSLEQGMRGYIPTSATLDVAVEAMRLVCAGGMFIPASSMIAARNCPGGSSESRRSKLSSMFTARQAEVVEALRQGKPNKVIAYDLNMQESTVKVHVRNIMKKLKAKNRTEVAYLTRELFGPGDND